MNNAKSRKIDIIVRIVVTINAAIFSIGLLMLFQNLMAQYSVNSSNSIYYNNEPRTVKLKKYTLKPSMYSYQIKGKDINNKTVEAVGWNDNEKPDKNSSIYLIKDKIFNEYYYFTNKNVFIHSKKAHEFELMNLKRKAHKIILMTISIIIISLLLLILVVKSFLKEA